MTNYKRQTIMLFQLFAGETPCTPLCLRRLSEGYCVGLGLRRLSEGYCIVLRTARSYAAYTTLTLSIGARSYAAYAPLTRLSIVRLYATHTSSLGRMLRTRVVVVRVLRTRFGSR